jgi:hypothetical protein
MDRVRRPALRSTVLGTILRAFGPLVQALLLLERLFRRDPWYRILSGIPAARTGGGAEPALVQQALASGRVLIGVVVDRAADV